MKPTLLLAFSLACIPGAAYAAPVGTAFSYQGVLSGAGTPATGNFDLLFSLYDAANNGNQVGASLTNMAVAVNNGLFVATLDFGNVFDGTARWLALGVRTNGDTGAFTALTPLQMLAPTPYALYATNAGAAGNIVVGSVSTAQLGTTGPSPTLGQVLAYNGTGLVWTNASQVGGGGGGGGGVWSLTGNSGTTLNVNFLGTTDDNVLAFKVDNVRGWQLQPTGDSPSLVGGAPGNFVAGGIVGATIGGGGTIALYGAAYTNSVWADHGTIGGGLGNTIQTLAYESTISGGNQNSIQDGANDSNIGGGYENAIQTGANYSHIGGGGNNSIQNGAIESSIGGGVGNAIQTNAYASTIAGGIGNTIQSNAVYSAIGGGNGNTIQSNAASAIIAGGNGNTVQSNAFGSIIGGGIQNTIQTNGYYSAIAGGYGNNIDNSAYESTIAGGFESSIESGAHDSTIPGGFKNIIETGAYNSTIGGGAENMIGGNAISATVPGGYSNAAAGNFSFAAGNRAKALFQGDFVWGDSQNADFNAFGNDEFCIRAQGGVTLDPTTSMFFGTQTRQMLNLWDAFYGIGVQNDREYFRAADTNAGFAWFLGGTHNDAPDNPGSNGVEVMNLTYGQAYNDQGSPDYTNGCILHVMGELNIDDNAYAQVFTSESDRNKKEKFEPVDIATVLRKVCLMPITTWNFKGHRDQHLGPMAQDFYAAFDLGQDEKHISNIDEGGVALAAIQGLDQKLEEQNQHLRAALNEKDAKIAQLEKELAEVKSTQRQTSADWEARFEELRKDVARLAPSGARTAASPARGPVAADNPIAAVPGAPGRN